MCIISRNSLKQKLMLRSLMILIYKPLGLTPLQALENLKKQKLKLSSEVLSYAGRLDPMAEGLILVLVGSENKKRREFERLDKEYEFEAILGIETDSFDLLGIPKIGEIRKVQRDEIDSFVLKNSNKIIQTLPPFSSYRVDRKPLYWWARRNVKIDIQKRKIEVKKLKLIDRYTISPEKFSDEIITRINLVKGDFRQKEILNEWKAFFKENKKESFDVLKFSFRCSSGGYVRSLVDSLGEKLGTKAVTFSIKRVKIGSFNIKEAVFLT